MTFPIQGSERYGGQPLDWRSILMAAWLPMLWWTVGVGGATLAGYPGVICMTPVGWLLGLSAGMRLVSTRETRLIPRLWTEAFLAGALIGVYQGLLAAVVMTFASPFGPAGASDATWISSIVLAFLAAGGVGAVACGAAAWAMAALLIRKAARGGERG